MSRTNLQPHHFSRLSFKEDGAMGDDDDAWALDSDEEQSQFASSGRQQGSSTASRLAAGSGSSRAAPLRAASTSSVTSTSSSSSSSARKHAPPARPHPFPIPPQSAKHRTASSSFSSSWTMVDASPLRSGRSSSGAQPLAGSPPTDVGSTAAEAVLQASLRDASTTSSGRARQETDANDADRREHLINSSVSMGRKREKDAHTFLRAIRPDLPAVVRDPLAALDSLAAEAAEPSVASPMTPGPTPTSALRQQREHVQNLGPGFVDERQPVSPPGSPVSSPLSPSASSFATPKPHRTPKTRQASHFDPVTMGGDGLIMGSGAFGSSSASLDTVGQNDDGQDVGQSSTEEEAVQVSARAPDRLRVPSSVAGGRQDQEQGTGLRREKSVRTKRRWREFFRCLHAGDSTADAHPHASGVDLPKLRELSWNGIPAELRPIVWPLLLGYLPSHSSTRTATLARKRAEYCKAVTLAFGYDPFAVNELDGEHKDVTRERTASRPSTPVPGDGKRAKERCDAIDKGVAQAGNPHGDGESEVPSGRRTPVSISMSRRSGPEEKIWHQISIDVPRTNPGLPLWQRKVTQRALERLLYVWALRHHATGYVQGMSDLATPFFEVFLSNYLRSGSCPSSPGSARNDAHHEDLSLPRDEMDPQHFDPSYLPLSARIALEADTFWCLSSLLDGIQENYIFAQPGIVRQVRRMEELVARIDSPLHAHLKAEGVEYIQFAFRWMNCLLMREMSVKNVVRLWDTYLAEGPDAFSDFHLYVCSVFLCKWSEQLKEKDFQGCIMFLQSLPTQSWSDKDAELLLSEAFVFKNLFGQTKHLND
ncbi:unnamed protein product [Parajaminaea phylloscopi]